MSGSFRLKKTEGHKESFIYHSRIKKDTFFKFYEDYQDILNLLGHLEA